MVNTLIALLIGTMTLTAPTNIYSDLAIVRDVNGTAVTVETGYIANGDFYGSDLWGINADDLETGDLVTLVMNDNGTPNDRTDDIIIDFTYNGYLY